LPPPAIQTNIFVVNGVPLYPSASSASLTDKGYQASEMAELILYESAAGYGLLEVVSWEDAAADQAADSLPRFSRAMKLKAIHPFANAMEALENANAISEHAMTDTLSNFLEMNVKRGKKGTTLGVIDPALATAIAEGTGISCRSDERVREVIRGCRMHWDHFSKTSNHDKAQLGLGHAYSRSKVKFNPARADNMIIQSIALLDTLDKDVNTFAMRVREWYSWHFPELKQLVKDNVQYARVAAYVGDRTTLSGGTTDNKLPGLAALLNDDETLAEQIIVASKHSMGVDCNETDMLNICNFTTRMVQLATYRHKLSLYLHDKMTTVAPNLSALIGDTVAARLISKAGSLTSLAKAPASTVQILGAEKAL
jgi:nucleolar protein 56